MTSADNIIKANLENSSKASIILSYLNENPLLLAYLQQTRIKIDLGSHYPGIILTEKQAFCALYVLFGFTFIEIGKKIGLSCKAVEDSILKVKQHLNIKTRTELVNCLFQSDFIDNMIVMILCGGKQ